LDLFLELKDTEAGKCSAPSTELKMY